MWKRTEVERAGTDWVRYEREESVRHLEKPVGTAFWMWCLWNSDLNRERKQVLGTCGECNPDMKNSKCKGPEA